MFFINQIITNIILQFTSVKAGRDDLGNTYYIHRWKKTPAGFKRRACIYKSIPEVSKIPPLWHMWITYATNQTPSTQPSQKVPNKAWQKPHMANASGTKFKYVSNKDEHCRHAKNTHRGSRKTKEKPTINMARKTQHINAARIS